MQSIEEFVHTHSELLEIERKAEIEENRTCQQLYSPKELEKKGVCVLKLRITTRSNGLYGRMVCHFEPFWSGNSLPSHSLSSGDIVGLQLSNNPTNDTLAGGVVTRVSTNLIQVAFDDDQSINDLDDDAQYRLMKLANDVTYKRLKKSLDRLNKYPSGGFCYRLISVLFGEDKIGEPYRENANFSIMDSNLNNSQREAVDFALRQRELAIIHGPPGTGKSTTVIEIIRQAVKSGMKVLTCAPSNVAVDNLVERLAHHKLNVVRLGHPARSFTHLQKYSLDAQLHQSDSFTILNDIRKEIEDTLNKRGGKRKWNEIKELRKEFRGREERAIKELLLNTDVVLSTLTSVTQEGPLKCLKEDHFGLTVIDECSQAIEPACWSALLFAKKCILAGDHQQLPPTIISKEAAKKGLQLTLMERQLNLHQNTCMRMLNIQYRMNEKIMRWPSDQLYKSKLVADKSVKEHLLSDLKSVEQNENTITPLLLIDTAGCNQNELQLQEEMSKGNEGEADLVSVHVESLLKSGLKTDQIAVITPYNLQVELLRCRLAKKYPDLEIKSVDGFQGREKEAVVISLVRSNDKGIVGFLAEDRRINVAITRAKRHLAIICDTATVSNHDFLASLINYLQESGEVRTAQTYLNDGSLDAIKTERPKSVNEALSRKEGNQTKKKQKKKKKNDIKDNEENKTKDFRNEKVDRNEETASRIERFTDQLNKFATDDEEMSLEFSTDLTSHDRLLVHEIADKLGLIHFSEGEKANRRVIVKKKKFTEIEEEDDYMAVSGMLEEQKEDRAISAPIAMVSKSDPGVFDIRKSEKEKSRKPKKTSKKKEKRSGKEKEEDFDTLIAQAVKENMTCFFGGCKTYTTVLGQYCSFCRKTFCLTHHIAEVHGCGDLAKREARKQIARDGKLFSGSGVPSKKPDPVKRAHLQRKLDKKLTELSDSRHRKPAKQSDNS